MNPKNSPVTSGRDVYSYDPTSHRVWRGQSGSSTDEVTFWSISGRKLATYQITQSGSTLSCTQTGINYYFGGKLIEANNATRSGWVYSDRLGSIGKFYPYGIERPSATTNGTEKFTGYFRDSETGNDYAISRYESPGVGRFLTPDRMTGSAADPGSWNKYAYTRGDPVNRVDVGGNCDESADVPGSFVTVCGDGTETPLSSDGSIGGNDSGGPMVMANAIGDPNSPCYAQVGSFTQDCINSLYGSPSGSVQVQALFPANNAYTPGQTQAVNNGLEDATTRVGDYGCAQLLAGNLAGGFEADVAILQATLANTLYRILPLADPTAGAQTIDSTDVFINSTGPFFNIKPGANGTVQVTMPNAQGNQTNFTFASMTSLQGFMLLHELGHQMGVFGPDQAAPVNGTYSAAVLDNCFTQNAQGVYQ